MKLKLWTKKISIFLGWNKNDITKCLDSDFWNNDEEYVHVKTKADGEFGNKLKNKCARRYYSLSTGLDLENACSDILGIENKNVLGSNSQYCYEYKSNINYFIYGIIFIILIF